MLPPLTTQQLFPLGPPVLPERMIDRRGEVATLAMNLASGSHTVLRGERRIGKTSVALAALELLVAGDPARAEIERLVAGDLAERRRDPIEALRAALPVSCLILGARIGMYDGKDEGVASTSAELAEGLEAAFAASRGLVTKAAKDAERAARRFVRALARQRVAFDPAGMAAGDLSAVAIPEATPPSGPARLARVLADADEYAAEHGSRVFVFLDEFHLVAGWPDIGSVQNVLRDALHNPSRDATTFLFAGSEEAMMQTLFSGPAAMRHSTTFLDIPSVLDEPEWRAGLRHLFDLGGAPITEDGLDTLLGASGGHVWRTMAIAHHCHRVAIDYHQEEVDAHVVAQGIAAAHLD